MSLQVHTIETASEKSAELLHQVKARFGFVPNLMGVFAESAETLKAYLALDELVEQTTLTPLERQLALIEASVCNSCEYCVAAHTSVASMLKLPGEAIQAVRENRPIADAKLETFRRFVQAATEQRGLVSEKEVGAFLDAGYTERNILEVILVIGLKVLSNYTNHIAGTPLDGAFEQAQWEKAAA
jgi:uncharacterized peroxidase-related enzyme